MTVAIYSSRCPQNHPCPVVKACPAGAPVQRGVKEPEVSEETCIDCGHGAEICPKSALVLKTDS